ncbi:MAG: hypothetical protein ACREQ7_17095 [Candidatus Binatia bacterium]
MIKVVLLLQALIITCVSCASTEVQRPEIVARPPAAGESFGLLAIPNSLRLGVMPDPVQPVENTLRLNVGPQTLRLKTFYLEKREPDDGFNGISQEGNLRRHFSILATSAFAGSGLAGEGELAYSPLDSMPGQSVSEEWPMLLRLGLRNHWHGLSYGANYRSFGAGFVSLTGARVDQPRNEAEFWGEHSFGPLQIRGSFGESWERFPDATDLRVTKTTSALFNFSRPQWGGTLASSYALAGQGVGLSQENTVLTTMFTGSYRPLGVLSLAPQFGIKEEWDGGTGIRTETPMTGFSIAYTPSRDWFKLTGGTSYTRSFSEDGVKNISTFGATAALDWKLGKLFAGGETLSFNINYNRHLDLSAPGNSRYDFIGMLQFKIFGF